MLTYKKLAEMCKVSTATISRVINEKEMVKVSKEKREKIQRIIKELGFVPNAIARSLSKGKTCNIAVAIRSLSEIMYPYFGAVISGIGSILQQEGYYLQLTTLNLGGASEHLPHYLNSIREGRVDGVCLMSQETKNEEILSLKKSGFPIVLIDKEIPNSKIPCVLIDNEMGAYIATKELIKLGHKRIAFMYAYLRLPYEKDRLSGYRRALREEGIRFDDDLVVRGVFIYEKDSKTVSKLLKMKSPPTAIFASEDRLAAYTLKAVTNVGISVPRQFSIIGVNAVFNEFTSPSLVSVCFPFHKIGEAAAKMLLKIVNKEPLDVHRLVFQLKLVGRDSIAKCPKG